MPFEQQELFFASVNNCSQSSSISKNDTCSSPLQRQYSVLAVSPRLENSKIPNKKKLMIFLGRECKRNFLCSKFKIELTVKQV